MLLGANTYAILYTIVQNTLEVNRGKYYGQMQHQSSFT